MGDNTIVNTISATSLILLIVLGSNPYKWLNMVGKFGLLVYPVLIGAIAASYLYYRHWFGVVGVILFVASLSTCLYIYWINFRSKPKVQI